MAYFSARSDGPGLYWRLASGIGVEERLTRAAAGETHVPDHFSPDGQTLVFTVGSPGGSGTNALWQLALATKESSLLIESPGLGASHAVFSPDGRWLAYNAYDTGDNEVYVQPFPPRGAKYQVPTRGDNHHPAWSADGRHLYYLPGPGRLERVEVSTERGVGFGTPVVLTFDPLRGAAPIAARSYDLMADGSILGTMAHGSQNEMVRNRIVVVLNWLEELKRLVPAQ